MRPAVFLDRDQTIITNAGDMGSPSGVAFEPGVADAVRALRQAGFALVVITNQAGVARGAFTEEDVGRVHARIQAMLEAQTGLKSVAGARSISPDSPPPQPVPNEPLIEAYYYCPYHPTEGPPQWRKDSPWRKPRPGMILAAAAALGLDLARSWMVGDGQRDEEAGAAAGCRTVRLAPPEARGESAADFVERGLPDAVRRILACAGADDRPRCTVVLRPVSGTALFDPAVQAMVESAATALAERTGVPLESIAVGHASVRATLVGEQIVGVGFAAELRRTTEAWYRSRHQASLWGEA